MRPKRRIRVEPTDVVKGVKLPAVSAIPYVVTLGRYKIPKHIEQTLSAGSAEQQITRIQQVNFPRKLTVRTYSVHWSTLLWVEEWRMKYADFPLYYPPSHPFMLVKISPGMI